AIGAVVRERAGPLVRDREGAHAPALLVARDVVAVEPGLEAPHVVQERAHRGGGQEPRDDEELVLRPVLAREPGRVEAIDRRVDLVGEGGGLAAHGGQANRSTCPRLEWSAGPPPSSGARASGGGV